MTVAVTTGVWSSPSSQAIFSPWTISQIGGRSSTQVGSLHPENYLEEHGDKDGRWHKEDGPALVSKRGDKEYWWHGTRVYDYVIEEPETITVWVIEREENAEIRRVMIERYVGKTPNDGLDGYGRYIRDSGAMEIDREEGIGILWRKELEDDEAIHMVEVLNSTIEKDGSRHRFFLRVPPDTRTARQAVAWTFGMKARDYQPMVET